MNKIKNEISSNTTFLSSDSYSFEKLYDNQAIFLKFWMVQRPLINTIQYYVSTVPGHIEGINGSTICGYNID